MSEQRRLKKDGARKEKKPRRKRHFEQPVVNNQRKQD